MWEGGEGGKRGEREGEKSAEGGEREGGRGRSGEGGKKGERKGEKGAEGGRAGGRDDESAGWPTCTGVSSLRNFSESSRLRSLTAPLLSTCRRPAAAEASALRVWAV